MSPNRFDATITSKRWGVSTTAAHSASIRTCSAFRSGWRAVACAKRSSQNGIVWMIPFDFVALQMRLERVAASSQANSMIWSVPLRVKIASCTASSSSVPWCSRPPISEYSPSLFSRTITMSTVSGVAFLSGEGMPGQSLTGRRFTYCRNAPPDRDQQAPQRDVVGHVGSPDRAEEDRVAAAELLEPVGRHHPPVLDEVVAAPRVVRGFQFEAVLLACRLKHFERGGRDFQADPVPRDHGDLVRPHGMESYPTGCRAEPETVRRVRRPRREAMLPSRRAGPVTVVARARWGRLDGRQHRRRGEVAPVRTERPVRPVRSQRPGRREGGVLPSGLRLPGWACPRAARPLRGPRGNRPVARPACAAALSRWAPPSPAPVL